MKNGILNKMELATAIRIIAGDFDDISINVKRNNWLKRAKNALPPYKFEQFYTQLEEAVRAAVKEDCTNRARNVLIMYIEKGNLQEVAENFNISLETAKSHIHKISTKSRKRGADFNYIKHYGLAEKLVCISIGIMPPFDEVEESKEWRKLKNRIEPDAEERAMEVWNELPSLQQNTFNKYLKVGAGKLKPGELDWLRDSFRIIRRKGRYIVFGVAAIEEEQREKERKMREKQERITAWEKQIGKQDIQLKELNITIRILCCLSRAGINTVFDLYETGINKLDTVRNMRPWLERDIVEALIDKGYPITQADLKMLEEKRYPICSEAQNRWNENVNLKKIAE